MTTPTFACIFSSEIERRAASEVSRVKVETREVLATKGGGG